MPGYNDNFDFNTSAGAHGMPNSLDAAPAPVMDLSGTWIAALNAPSGLMEGDTAAPLHARLDFAPFEGAKPSGKDELGNPIACAVCLSTYQNAFGLDNHAKEATHQAYKCKCGTGFNTNRALKRHIDTKDAPKTFPCTLCYDEFTRKDKLKDHCRHYHKVTDEGLRALFNAQEPRPRGATSRRHRTPIPLAAAPSRPAPTHAPAAPPALAPAPAGPSFWSFPADFFAPPGPLATTSPFVPAGSFGSSGAFVPAADPFAAAATAASGAEISGALDNTFWDGAWTTGFGSFNL